ncbi:MAG: dihydrofolate reductase family protein [Thiovulaceae bacterium]|nr:dihydrofolate reductase family protein [Sulfurimonadaceae bacterium]
MPLSTTVSCLPKAIGNVELFSGSISELMAMLSMQNYEHIYIDGGKTIQSFLEEELVSEMTITTIPLLLGEGLSLFGNLSKSKELKLISSQGYANGFVQSRYAVVN